MIVLPYREIDASGVLMTAISAGVPIVATKVGLFAELLEDGRHGRLIAVDDHQALARALDELVLKAGRYADRLSVNIELPTADALQALAPEKEAGAIKPDTVGGLEKRLSLNAEFSKIWPNITVKRDPPPDAEEWDGVPDKEKFFSPKGGKGD